MTDKVIDTTTETNSVQSEMEAVIKTAISAQTDLNLENGFFDEVVFSQCVSTSGLTADQVRSVRTADADFIRSATKAWGEHSIGEMQKNKELLKTSAEFDMLGGKNAQIEVDRTGTIFAGAGKPPVEAFGVTNVSVKDKGVKGPELKSIRSGLRNLGNTKLAK